MPSNTKGGKGYKKKKKQANTDEPIFIDRQMGQMPARAIRLLGNRNVLCYSNDNVLRLCHICGKMKGRVFIEPGDVVLITLREFGVFDPKKLKEVKNGDIIAKYASQQFAALKKEDGVNPKLFMKLETGGHCVGEIGTDYTDAVMNVPEDEGFDFEHSDSDSESGCEEEKPKTEIIETAEVEIDIDNI
jgi:translation initiation factor 1A